MTERTDQWDESMCGIWRVKPEEKKMTKQERFERFQADEIKMDYEELKQKFDQSEKITGERYSKNGQFFRDWRVWSAAAQQKEGCVLVPVESIQEVLSWLDDNSDAFEYAASSHVRECIKHRDILQQAIEAAQEAE